MSDAFSALYLVVLMIIYYGGCIEEAKAAEAAKAAPAPAKEP